MSGTRHMIFAKDTWNCRKTVNTLEAIKNKEKKRKKYGRLIVEMWTNMIGLCPDVNQYDWDEYSFEPLLVCWVKWLKICVCWVVVWTNMAGLSTLNTTGLSTDANHYNWVEERCEPLWPCISVNYEDFVEDTCELLWFCWLLMWTIMALLRINVNHYDIVEYKCELLWLYWVYLWTSMTLLSVSVNYYDFVEYKCELVWLCCV